MSKSSSLSFDLKPVSDLTLDDKEALRNLGWQAFNGTLLVEQPGGTVSFTLNKTMVLPIADKAPQKGCIDLCGLLW